MFVQQVGQRPRLVLEQIAPWPANAAGQSPSYGSDTRALKLFEQRVEQTAIARSLGHAERGHEAIDVVDEALHDQQHARDAIALLGKLLGQDVAGRGHLGRYRDGVVWEEAPIVMLIGHHLDALVDFQPLKHLTRLATQLVTQEDVPAVVPVEAILAETM